MAKFDEKHLVEDYIIEQLKNVGWRFVPADQLERESYEEPLLVSTLVRCIQKVNKDSRLGDEEISKVLNELKLVTSGQEGAKRILNYYKFGVPVKFEKERVIKYVQLFDFNLPSPLRLRSGQALPSPLKGEGIRGGISPLKGEGIEGRVSSLKGEGTTSLKSSPLTGEDKGGGGNNEFVVTRQVYYSGRDKIRTDIMLYVNGIPLVNIECKDPTKPGVSWYDAFVQIKDYENIVPELYKYVQIGIAAESKAKYFPVVPWQDKDSVKYHEWRSIYASHCEKQSDEAILKDEIATPSARNDKLEKRIRNGGEQNSIDATIEILEPNRLLDIVKNFLFSRVEMGNATKVITRYMQYRAANKIVERVLINLRYKDEIASPSARNDRGGAGLAMTEIRKDKGLIWHWQGSGKTLTMIFAAHKLYYDIRLENPTIFFIVDRIELEEQLYTEFYALDIMQPEIIQSIADLQDVLKYDNYRGKRGIFITLIHKFRPDELARVQKQLEDISENRDTIMTRKNVIAFVDEGHRSQYGMLAAQMKAILKNAFAFALTGTPISKPKHGRDTYLEFAYPPDEQYLDRYFIVDSIRDGFTVKIVYQPHLEKDVHLKKDMLETFLEVELDEIPEQARSDVEEKLKQKLNPINVFLENRERIEQIAEDIASHFRENVDGKFKAMIVAASRKACVYYENALKKYLPREYFDVVMTSEHDDADIIYGHVREARERYDGKDYKSTLKKIIEKFKENEHPKILIVTDMLLTGFDVPQLQLKSTGFCRRSRVPIDRIKA
jgi:type I restriction enzyme R subunit